MRLSTSAFAASAVVAAALLSLLANSQMAERSFAAAGTIWAKAMADNAGQPLPVDDHENTTRMVAATPPS